MISSPNITFSSTPRFSPRRTIVLGGSVDVSGITKTLIVLLKPKFDSSDCEVMQADDGPE